MKKKNTKKNKDKGNERIRSQQKLNDISEFKVTEEEIKGETEDKEKPDIVKDSKISQINLGKGLEEQNTQRISPDIQSRTSRPGDMTFGRAQKIKPFQ